MWQVRGRKDMHTGFCGKHGGKKLLGRPKDNIKMNFHGVE
jgi:hypothetical protein